MTHTHTWRHLHTHTHTHRCVSVCMLRAGCDMMVVHREAYVQALAPHHPWLLRRAAELLFLALPERHVFLELVCVTNQEEAGPVLHTLTHALRLVHTRTQLILETHNMLELP